MLEDGANKLTVHRVDLTEYVTSFSCNLLYHFGAHPVAD